MTTVVPVPEGLLGTWVHALPWDSDEYLAEYSISLADGALSVAGFETNGGEEFVISDVEWDGEWLRFRSLMPSTGRVGTNEFRLVQADRIESRFTFTVIEEMIRK